MSRHTEVLKANFELVEGSFLYFLHDLDTFNEDAFRDYLRSLIGIVEESLHKPLDRNIAYMIIHTYGYILRSLIYHNQTTDLLEIQNCPSEEAITMYIETMRIIVEGYFSGYKINPDILEKNT